MFRTLKRIYVYFISEDPEEEWVPMIKPNGQYCEHPTNVLKLKCGRHAVAIGHVPNINRIIYLCKWHKRNQVTSGV